MSTAATVSNKPDKNQKRWDLLASLHGYNELAKLSDTLGQKVYCRLICRELEKILSSEYGIDVKHTNDEGATVLTLGNKPPYIVFHARDIEMMRQAVADFDSRQGK